jgi:hypothetical protein
MPTLDEVKEEIPVIMTRTIRARLNGGGDGG